MCEISIVIPIYNKRRYLKDTVNSLLGQSFRDFELLLIDDGSTDRSGILCDELSCLDERIKTFHTENHGVGAARNFGIWQASGTYICFIDADDLVHEPFLEKLYSAVKKEDADLAVCGYYEVKYAARTDRDLGQSDTGSEIYDILRYNVLCVLWNKLFVREKIRHLFDENLSTAEDSLFCAQFYLDNHPKIAYVRENLYRYVRRADGLTGSLRAGALCGIRRLYNANLKILAMISDRKLKWLGLHHVYKVYFYGIYTFIFENICDDPTDKKSLAIVAKIIREPKYRRIIKQVLRYPLCDKRAEKTTKKEVLYILFSLLGMKRSILLLAKLKKSLDPYKGCLKQHFVPDGKN